MFLTTPTNIPENAFRYLRTGNKFQEYISGVWTDRVISVAGGGTGGANATDARTNLGLGTMATQNANNVNITGGVISGIAAFTVSGAITAGSFIGDGAGLTNLNADQLLTGTIPDGRFPAILPALDGSNLINLNAAALAFGTVDTARLGSGAAGTTTFLRGDQTWSEPPSAGGFPPGLIVISPVACPPGWTRVNLDGFSLRVSSVWGDGGGSDTHAHGVGSYAAPAHTHAAGTYNTVNHNHGGSTGTVSITVSGNTGSGGGHNHDFSASFSGTTDTAGSVMNVDAGGSGWMTRDNHVHSFSASVSGTTASVGGHTHSFSGSGSGTGSISNGGTLALTGSSASGGGGAITGASAAASNVPRSWNIILCQKD